MANNRIYYATHQVGLKADGDAGDFTEVHGAQSVGMTTNFNLEQVFELGQLAIYENIEGTPDVSVDLQKVLDGYPPIFLLATVGATYPTLASRSTQKCVFGLSIFSDELEYATGAAPSVVECSGMYINSVSYTFPVEGNFTEDVSLVGNNKVWANDSRIINPNIGTPTFDGAFTGTDSPIGLGGVNRRENILFEYDAGEGLDTLGRVADYDATILPVEVHGITTSGTNEQTDGQKYDAHIQSISVSFDLGREDLNELGKRTPYYRAPTYPIEVTCAIETISTSGDMVSGTEEGILTTGTGACDDAGNLSDNTIRIATCEGTRIYLGLRNKLSSVSYTGGDAGGGNVATTYNYTNFNICTVMHSGDPNTNFTWSNRATYLRDV